MNGEAAIQASEHTIAYFITPHGYGHAARASAVMQAFRQVLPQVHFLLFTETPEWFFSSSLDGGWTYISFASDLGLVQTTPFDEDIKATVRKLKWMQSTEDQRLEYAVRILQERGCRLVLCDIAASGILAAQRAGLPSVLIENFTWDFIYESYEALVPELREIRLNLREIYARAELHIQARPVCQPDENAIQVEPAARRAKNNRNEIRRRLRLMENEPVILVTQGGIETRMNGIESLKAFDGIRFILPGAADQPEWDGNLIRLPHHSSFYTPDLVYASDAVIGKLGYGTVAEVYQAGLPFGYIPRESFPETRSMAKFVQAEMQAIELSYKKFMKGEWGNLPLRLMDMPRIQRNGPNGVDQIVEIVRETFSF